MEVTSANFAFLRAHDPQLVTLGSLAERYFNWINQLTRRNHSAAFTEGTALVASMVFVTRFRES